MLHTYEEINSLVQSALIHAGASPSQAQATAEALVFAEACGLLRMACRVSVCMSVI